MKTNNRVADPTVGRKNFTDAGSLLRPRPILTTDYSEPVLPTLHNERTSECGTGRAVLCWTHLRLSSETKFLVCFFHLRKTYLSPF